MKTWHTLQTLVQRHLLGLVTQTPWLLHACLFAPTATTLWKTLIAAPLVLGIGILAVRLFQKPEAHTHKHTKACPVTEYLLITAVHFNLAPWLGTPNLLDLLALMLVALSLMITHTRTTDLGHDPINSFTTFAVGIVMILLAGLTFLEGGNHFHTTAIWFSLAAAVWWSHHILFWRLFTLEWRWRLIVPDPLFETSQMWNMTKSHASFFTRWAQKRHTILRNKAAKNQAHDITIIIKALLSSVHDTTNGAKPDLFFLVTPPKTIGREPDIRVFVEQHRQNPQGQWEALFSQTLSLREVLREPELPLDPLVTDLMTKHSDLAITDGNTPNTTEEITFLFSGNDPEWFDSSAHQKAQSRQRWKHLTTNNPLLTSQN